MSKKIIKQLWDDWAPYWHICATLVALIAYLCTFIGLPSRVDALESKVAKIDTLTQRVEDIAEFLQVPKRTP